ncbi:MAG: hypothetical protein FK733_07115 [Asgard group archaeon]|nr:hypothetical protein [Asgard group archaeon]
MSSRTNELLTTQVTVKCKLCDEEISFDIADDASYLSKTDHKSFFGMMLKTYRIEHLVNGEKHLNAVLLDKQNLFRGYIDAYIIPVLQDEQQLGYVDLNSFLVLEQEIETLNPNAIFTNFFIVNLSGWILEIVKNKHVKTEAILEKIFEKIDESRKIYTVIPQPLTVKVANLDCYIWNKGRNYLIMTLSENNYLAKIVSLMEQITNGIEKNDIIPKKRIFRMFNAVLILTNLIEKRPDLVLRLLSDDLFYSKIKIKYPDRIRDIIPKIANRHQIPEDVMEELLLGKISLIGLFEKRPELIKDCKRIIEALDFIDRRKLLI